MPPNLAIALALLINGSVQMTAVGMPIRSSVIPSCTLHDEHEPQSPEAVITTSHWSAISATMGAGHGLDALPLLRVTVPANS